MPPTMLAPEQPTQEEISAQALPELEQMSLELPAVEPSEEGRLPEATDIEAGRTKSFADAWKESEQRDALSAIEAPINVAPEVKNVGSIAVDNQVESNT